MFKASRIWPLFALTAIFGCHSPQLKSPSEHLNAEQTTWLERYRHALTLSQSDSPQACRLFQDLADNPRFPARDMARIRMWENCTAKAMNQFDRSVMPTYLRDLSLSAILKQAQALDDGPAVISLALEKSRQKLPQSEKLKWVDVALERARKLEQVDQIRDLQLRKAAIAPRLTADPQPKDYLAVASDFRLARQFAKARDFYERVIRDPSFSLDDKITALKGLRLAAKNERRLEEHLRACERLVSFLKSKKSAKSALFDAQMYYARALWTQDHGEKARALLNSVEKSHHGRGSLAELYWLKARMAEEKKDYSSVAQWLDAAVKQKTNDSGLRDKILWYSAWNERRLGRPDAAIQRFQYLDEQTQDEFLRMRGLFWLAKTFEDAKRPQDAHATLERLVAQDPLGYYGLLAHRQLGKEIRLQRSSLISAPVKPTSSAPVDSALAEWLNMLGENEALIALLDEASEAYKRSKEANEDGWTMLFKLYAKAGYYTKLFERLAAITPESRKTILELHPELLFPQPWPDDVRAASFQFGVKSELIYSIMRQESAFDPRARSLADAFGLLQILPEVAENLAAPNKISYQSMEDLYRPEINIRVGAAHLQELLHRHKGQFILAVASYNASESAIRGWLKTRYRGDALEFIEEIPYEETRAYVRLVMRNLIFYSLLSSRTASIEFPSWLLTMNALADAN